MTNEEVQQPRDKKDLKIMALSEEISRLVNQVTDLRVELTILGQQLNQALAAQQNDPSEVPDVPSEED